MTFLLPLGLLALLTLPVIVILHLLRERRQRMTVPSLLHWLNVPRPRDGERVRRLPLTLLLLLHLLAAALLGLALGRPQLAGALRGGAGQTAIVLDTSTSMAAQTGTTTRFAQAQERARSVLRGMGAGDRVTLIAAGRTARIVASGGAGDVAGIMAALDRLRPGGTGTDIDGALTLAEATLDPQDSRQIIVLTDGALPTTPARTLTAPVDWQVVGSAEPNRAIVVFALRPWGTNIQVYARAANYGPAPLTTRLRLFGAAGAAGQDEQLLDTRDVTMAAGGETELTWTLPRNYATLRAELDGSDSLPQDDLAFLNVAPVRPVSTLLVSDQPDALRRALAVVPGVNLRVVEPAGYAAATRERPFDLTIFDGFLPEAWPGGATLAINPPSDSTLLEVGPRAEAQGELRQQGAVLEGLSLGGVNFGTIRSVAPPAWAETQLAIGNTPLIMRGRAEGHEIAIWAFDLAGSNLPTRLAFPILVAHTVRDLAPAPLPSSILAGAALTLRPDSRVAEIQITGPDDTPARLPAAPAVALDTLTQPGFYRIEERQNNTASFAGLIGVNAGSPLESDLRPQPAPAIVGPDQADAAPAERRMRDLWPWLALGALAILMLEWGYIHR